MAPAAAGKETTAAMLRHGSKLVSYAYFFSAWGDRMWEFSGVLFVLELFSDTLLPSSLFGFIEVLVGILTSSRIGNYIDTHDRLKVMRESVTTACNTPAILVVESPECVKVRSMAY